MERGLSPPARLPGPVAGDWQLQQQRRWSHEEFDALIEQAAATDNTDEQARIYAQAEDILAEEAPVVPFSYGESWSLARDGLLGADTAGVGIVRIAGMDWAPGSGR